MRGLIRTALIGIRKFWKSFRSRYQGRNKEGRKRRKPKSYLFNFEILKKQPKKHKKDHFYRFTPRTHEIKFFNRNLNPEKE